MNDDLEYIINQRIHDLRDKVFELRAAYHEDMEATRMKFDSLEKRASNLQGRVEKIEKQLGITPGVVPLLND